MTTSFKQSIFFFLLLCFANLIAGIFNEAHNYAGGLKDVLESMPGLGVTSAVFWVSCQWKPDTKLRLFFLPVLRVLFWTIIVASGFWNNNCMVAEDILYANNELFFWWTSLKILTSTLWNNNDIIKLFVIDILSIAVGQLIFIYTAILLEKRIDK